MSEKVSVERDSVRSEHRVTVRIGDVELAGLQWRITDRVVEILAHRLADGLTPAAALHVRVHQEVMFEAVRQRIADRMLEAVDRAVVLAIGGEK